MKFSLALAALFLPVLVNAQYGDPSPTSTSTGSATGTTSSSATTSTGAPPSNSTNINVQVAAGGQLMYSPANFTASNGTTVTFIISSGPHSVTQGSFADPCVYLAAAGGNPAGFDSGLQTGKQFSIQITNDQEPIYFFCKEDDHCGLGMVGAINAPTTGNTYAAFQAAAKALGSSETPLSDTGPVTGGVGAVATNTPVSTTASSSSTTKGSSATSSGSSSSANHLVADGFFALFAAALGLTLV